MYSTMKRRTAAVLFVFFLFVMQQVNAHLIVETPVGKIQGLATISKNDQPYVSFRNIPYAKPPVGDLRFAKPQPYPVFETTFDATRPTVNCIQAKTILFRHDQGQEDCLILNIYLKDLLSVSETPKKVLVFIHGGGFTVGSSSLYDLGSFVTGHDIIVVTINYRLGVLGFLSSMNEASPGNYGLWDQALALKWVKDNIAAFGGDADDITISGESAGAASVSLLSLSPVTKDLFTKVYSQSGSATSNFAKTTDPVRDFFTVAKTVNCFKEDGSQDISVAKGHEILQCLRMSDAFQLSSFEDHTLSSVCFAPVVDGIFIPSDPAKLLNDNNYLKSVGFYDKPNLVVLNNNEQAITDQMLDMLKQNIFSKEGLDSDAKGRMLNKTITSSKTTQIPARLDAGIDSRVIIDKVWAWYERRFGDKALSSLSGDLAFNIPPFDVLNALARGQTSHAWLLYFNHFPEFMKGQARGIIHGLDLVYWFDLSLPRFESLLLSDVVDNFTDEDERIKELFSAVIAEFSKTGNPKNALKDHLDENWPPYNLQDNQYLDFNSRPSVQRHLFREKRQLWEELVPIWTSELRNSMDASHTEL